MITQEYSQSPTYATSNFCQLVGLRGLGARTASHTSTEVPSKFSDSAVTGGAPPKTCRIESREHATIYGFCTTRVTEEQAMAILCACDAIDNSCC